MFTIIRHVSLSNWKVNRYIKLLVDPCLLIFIVFIILFSLLWNILLSTIKSAYSKEFFLFHAGCINFILA